MLIHIIIYIRTEHAIFQAAYTLLTSLAKQVLAVYPLAFSSFPDKVNYYLWDFPDFGLFSNASPTIICKLA